MAERTASGTARLEGVGRLSERPPREQFTAPPTRGILDVTQPANDPPLVQDAAFAMHDARNMLAAIVLNVDHVRTVLPAANTDPSVREALDEILEAGRRIEAILTQAIETARGRSVRALSPARRPVSAVVAEAQEAVRRLARNAGVAISVRGGGDGVPAMDHGLLLRVVVNLLQNAIHHSPRGGTVELSYNAGEQLRLTVHDEGPGVRPSILPRIFDPYITTGATTGHAGLGLAFCRSVLEAHRGSITASDAQDGGARFVVTLPLT
ncbi:MAG: HAMP domain-containing histidine kinase [Deltaproteobacteria bacterium]|nr:HAMP domain-containing histidine kinase [Deltaproteobacteria bacterium]